MTYRLEFLPSARREWRKLGSGLRTQFERKLAERLENPRVPGDRLRGSADIYKIKLRSAGYRLVYRVEDARITVIMIAIGKRERGAIYRAADKRMDG
ncbi:MAG: type II toxin-antitoxin system RelE family toxin [Jhaorihella sp.]